MDSPTSTATAEPTARAKYPELPDALFCELCGDAFITVVVTWLGTQDNSRTCGACYLTTATGMVLAFTDAPAN